MGGSIPYIEVGRVSVLTAKEFKALLKKHGWNGRKISKSLGHDPSWLSKKLHGAREMKCEEMLQICQLTGISPHALLGWNETEAADAGSRLASAGGDDAVLHELAKVLTPTQRQTFIEILRAGLQSK
jgi:hypothetical protein